MSARRLARRANTRKSQNARNNERTLKLAAVPVPLANVPTPLPASVLVAPLGVTSRMRLFQESATYTLPAVLTATPDGNCVGKMFSVGRVKTTKIENE